MNPHTQNTPATGNTRLVLVALALAVAAAIMTNLYIAYHSDVQQRSFDVFVLTRSVNTGDQLKDNDWQVVSVPEKFASHFDALGAMNLRDIESLVRKDRFRRPARRGAPLTYDLFTATTNMPLDMMVTKGTVHMDLPVNWRLVPTGVRPGVRVDIEANLDTGKGIPEVLPVVEAVKVVGVNRQTIETEQLSRSEKRLWQRSPVKKITIQVKPQQSTILSMIEKIAIGDFELRLRHPDDNARRLDVLRGEINPQVVDLLHELHRKSPPKRRSTR